MAAGKRKNAAKGKRPIEDRLLLARAHLAKTGSMFGQSLEATSLTSSILHSD